MVMTEDPQLGAVATPFGSVTFIQIVGVCVEELQAAQQWNGPGLIDIMKSVPGVGGAWLVTDMRRGETIFELDPDVKLAVDDGINAEGSNLSGVTAKCSWSEKRTSGEAHSDSESSGPSKSENSTGDTKILSTHGQEDEDDATRGALSPTICSRSSRHSSMSIERKGDGECGSRMSCNEPQPLELVQTRFLESVHITLNSEAGVLLPLALRGRLKHGRHFTFKTVNGDLAITLLTETVSGAYATKERPYALHASWLQVLISSETLDDMVDKLSELQTPDGLALPKTYAFPDAKLSFTIEPEEEA